MQPFAGQESTLDALLARHLAQRPDAVALEFRELGAAQPAPEPDNWRKLSYRDLAWHVHAMARRLQPQLRPGDRVAWLGLNHPAQIALLFALARIGAVLVPLNHRLAPAEWAAVLADCTPVLLLHDADFAPAALAATAQLAQPPQLRSLAWLIGDPVPEDGAEAPQAPPPDASATPVLLVYTSGTTGAPKGALHTQGNLLANMAMAAAVQALTPQDVVATVLPLFHVGGLCIQTLPALWAGARVLLFSRFDASATLACFEADRPSLSLQVPATLKALIEHPRWPDTNLGSLRTVWAGSSVLPDGLIAAFHARSLPVCNVYGSTETGPFSIALPPAQAHSHVGSCGWPAPGVEVLLCDPHGAAVQPGAVGEICVRAANVVRHYWPDTPACDEQGFFHTGDLARQAEDGSYTVVGRAKDMVISGGENVYPAEIENLLNQHPLVAECAVLGQADARWGEVVVAVVVLRDGQAAPEDWAEALRGTLDGRLARYKWPRRWLRADSLPKTALGKVQKPALQAWLAQTG